MILLNISIVLKTRYSQCSYAHMCKSILICEVKRDTRFCISHQSPRNAILSNKALILVSQDYKTVFDSSWWPPPDGIMSLCFGCCCQALRPGTRWSLYLGLPVVSSLPLRLCLRSLGPARSSGCCCQEGCPCQRVQPQAMDLGCQLEFPLFL